MNVLSKKIEVKRRAKLPLLCNKREIQVAIEIGTDLGVFAAEFIKRFDGELVCIDPYLPGDEFPWDRTADLMMACLKLQPWHGRVRIIKQKSSEVVDDLPRWIKNRVGFVYIDAHHDFDSVKEDMDAWWPLLPSNGILAGHDYHPDHPGVIEAVDQFATANGLTIFTTPDDFIPSWYIYKTTPKELIGIGEEDE